MTSSEPKPNSNADELLEVPASRARVNKRIEKTIQSSPMRDTDVNVAERRSILRRKTDISSLPISHSYVWKEFTPTITDGTRCLARTWSRGRGGQCSCRPSKRKKLCLGHWKNAKKEIGLTHGLVTGAIPGPKLLEFQKERDRCMSRIRIYGKTRLAIKIENERKKSLTNDKGIRYRCDAKRLTMKNSAMKIQRGRKKSLTSPKE